MKPVIKDLGKVCITPEGDWDIKKEYANLSVVFNRNDAKVYISKQCVPKNIDILNTDYWHLLVDFDSIVNDMTTLEIKNHVDNAIKEYINNINYLKVSAAQYDSLTVITEKNSVNISVDNVHENDVSVESYTTTIPAATTENAGVMSAEDKKNATILTGILFTGAATHGDVIFTSHIVNSGQYIELTVDEIYTSGGVGFYDKNDNLLSSVLFTIGTNVLAHIPEGFEYAKAVFNADFKVLTVKTHTALSDLESKVNTIFTTEVEFTKGNYISFSGITSSPYNNGYYSDFYPVNKLNKVVYSGKSMFNAAACVIFDSEKDVISTVPSEASDTGISYDELEISLPENAAFIRFGSFAVEPNARIESPFTSAQDVQSMIEVIKEGIDIDKIDNILAKKSVIWVGDSIMEGSVRMTPSFGGFAKIVADRNSMQSTNYGIGGTCITKLPGKTNSIVERVENYSKNVDYIILQGGLNDIVHAAEVFGEISTAYNIDFDKETFCGACEWLCKYVIKNYSTKKYGFIITYNINNYDWRDRWAEAIVSVCKKWGMPFLDLRSEAGFNLASTDLRELYGTYIGNVAEYDVTKGYALDEQVKYNGALYKANVDIPSPAGEFDDSKWTLQESGNASDYDNWHCNVLAYQKLADKVEAWMRTL